MKTEKIIKDAILRDIQGDQENYELYLKVFEALRKHDGEKITKRLATSVEKSLGPDYDVYYSTEYGLLQIKIRRKGESSDKYKVFLLGHESKNPAAMFRLESGDENKSKDCRYTERGFDYHACCYGRAAKERIEKNENFLKSAQFKKLAALQEKRLKLEDELKALDVNSYDFPAYYSVEKAIKTKQESES